MDGRTAGKLGWLASAGLLAAIAVVGCSASSKSTITMADNAPWQPPATPTPTMAAESTESLAKVTGYDAHALLEHRVPYVGDNSKVVGLIDLLPLPGGLSRESVELQTSAEPYGVSIQYKIDMEMGITFDAENGDPFTLGQWFYRHAAILLSLIGNADYITFKVDNARTISGEDRYVYRLDRNDIEAVYGDIRGLADDEVAFRDYVGKMSRLGAIDMSPSEVLKPDSEGHYLLSRNEVRTADGDILYINLEMIDGKHYTEEEAGGPGGGIYTDNYIGSYRLRVVDSTGETRSTYKPLEDQLNFWAPFELAIADYNNDGQPDFTLGQHASSNGAVYEIYSLNERGEIVSLNANRDLYVADHRPSILLDQIEADSFLIRFYTPDQGYEQRTFRWDGAQFAATMPEPSQ